MKGFELVGLLLTLAAGFSYLNYQKLKLPHSIGIMLISVCFSLLLILIGQLGYPVHAFAEKTMLDLDFHQTLMGGMLSFLLFAGSLHIDISDLKNEKGVIACLATGGLLLSISIIGFAAWFLAQWFGHPISLAYCLLFGALISPTDPIAVLALLKTSNAPTALQTTIAGESLFNDGVGVVAFAVLLKISQGEVVGLQGIVNLVFLEAVGGVAFGILLGFCAYYLLKKIDNYQTEILITLAVVTGGFALAQKLHVSGLLSIVVAGLIIGNKGRADAMSEETREHLDEFWSIIDDIFNAVLFLIIGLELVVLNLSLAYLLVAVGASVLVLAARFASNAAIITVFRPWRKFSNNIVKLLTWGGLRGGISVALALSLPSFEDRSLFITATFGVVLFSVFGLGLTFKKFIKAYPP